MFKLIAVLVAVFGLTACHDNPFQNTKTRQVEVEVEVESEALIAESQFYHNLYDLRSLEVDKTKSLTVLSDEAKSGIEASVKALKAAPKDATALGNKEAAEDDLAAAKKAYALCRYIVGSEFYVDLVQALIETDTDQGYIQAEKLGNLKEDIVKTSPDSLMAAIDKAQLFMLNPK